MTIAHEAQSGALASGTQHRAVAKTPWWESPALFRYGFVALVLIIWGWSRPSSVRSFYFA